MQTELLKANLLTKTKLLSLAVASASLLVACGGDDNDSSTPQPTPLESLAIDCATVSTAEDTSVTGTLQLNLTGTYVSGNEFDTASAEIVSYDSCSDKLYVVNAKDQTVDVLGLGSDDSAPAKEGTIDLSLAADSAGIEIGDANSVSAKQGLVAVAIQADTKQDDGIIALYRSDTLALINTYAAGALPDMVALSEDARYILAANEGEPSSDYSNDPEGSITLVDLAEGYADDEAVVTQLSFTGFNNNAPDSVRLAGPEGTTAAQDIEPEYLTISADNRTAWVALQENNALAVVDIENATISSLVGLGTKSWDAESGNQLDPSNKDGGPGVFDSYEQLVGLYMPDTITSIDIAGETYILSANEGDGREYVYETTQETCDAADGHIWDDDNYINTPKYSTEEGDCISFIDEARGKDIVDDVADSHPLKEALGDKEVLGRIKVVTDSSIYESGDDIVTFGARSFSIWNTEGTLVYDSGDSIAEVVHKDNTTNFNSTNDANNSGDNRSDDKGTEPEAIEAAQIGDRVFAFVGLERQGGVIVYDITNPEAPEYQSYLNNRDYSEPVCTAVDEDEECDNDTYNEAVGDLGPESIDYFSRAGKHFIAVGNEVSGTTSVYEISFN